MYNQIKFSMTLCKYCNKPIQPIGFARKNGRPHEDWATRKLHKKCWKLQLDIAAQKLNHDPDPDSDDLDDIDFDYD